MGVINVTPDSFYSLSRKQTEKEVLDTAVGMISDGVDILDIGGYSSRPDAINIDEKTEKSRVLSSIKAVIKEIPKATISIDTFRGDIAHAAVNEGASMINDISGGNLDPAMFKVLASLKVPYVLMHMKGTPQTMQKNPEYEDVYREVFEFFEQKIKILNFHGVHDVIIDPGFGFGKTLEDNYKLLNQLDGFKVLDRPILVGISRKSMITKLLDVSAAADSTLNATTALNTIALMKGATILRVHDVAEAKEVVKLTDALKL